MKAEDVRVGMRVKLTEPLDLEEGPLRLLRDVLGTLALPLRVCFGVGAVAEVDAFDEETGHPWLCFLAVNVSGVPVRYLETVASDQFEPDPGPDSSAQEAS